MADSRSQDANVSRREIFELGSAALAATTLAVTASAESQAQQPPEKHNAPNETDPGPRNLPLAKQNPDSEWPPETDNGSVKPFKYSFAFLENVSRRADGHAK